MRYWDALPPLRKYAAIKLREARRLVSVIDHKYNGPPSKAAVLRVQPQVAGSVFGTESLAGPPMALNAAPGAGRAR